MGTNNWAQNSFTDGHEKMNSAIFTPNISILADEIIKGTFGNGFTAIEDYISSIMYFPINQDIFDFLSNAMTITDKIFTNQYYTKTFDNISAVILSANHPVLRGFYMGKYDFNQISNGEFTDFEPYTSITIYLPFFGFAELKVRDVYKQIAVFRLCIDFRTGQGTYYIYTTPNDFEYENGDHTFNVSNLTNATLIGTYSCQVGAEVPINTIGNADQKRNAILATSQFILGVGIAATTKNLPLAYSVTTASVSPQKSTIYGRNPNTNRMIKTEEMNIGGYTTNTEHSSYQNTDRQIINSSAALANNILANFTSPTEMSRGSSVTNQCASTPYIHIIVKKAKMLPIDSSYAHIFGKPLGEVKNCSEVSGFTKFTDFHISIPRDVTASNPTTNIGLMTSEELNMINDIMTSGAYL